MTLPRRTHPAPNFQSQRDEVIRSHEKAHAAYYRAEVFGGPSLYFHQQALLAAEADVHRFAELAYAVLTSWGMHRMGPGGSKMREYTEFKASLEKLWTLVSVLRQAVPESLDESGWRDLRTIFVGIRCMASGTSLVGNSKVMAHALPRLVPPMDRRYTLKFLFGNGRVVNGIDGEWETLKTILREFFYPVARAEPLEPKLQAWMKEIAVYRWDTSPLKIVDNLVIGLSKIIP